MIPIMGISIITKFLLSSKVFSLIKMMILINIEAFDIIQ